jgi:hypothetical protein
MRTTSLSSLFPGYGRRVWFGLVLAAFWVAFFGSIPLAAQNPNTVQAHQDVGIQTAHVIGVALFSYATDHEGKYPEGKTSTEVFQHLLDEKYVSDPAYFYLPMEGKVQPTSATLKPENVCWDVTCCLDADSPAELPLVFTTGFKITYRAGSPAVQTGPSPWGNAGLVVCYPGMKTFFLVSANKSTQKPVIDATFDPKGKAYHQLTPDGK